MSSDKTSSPGLSPIVQLLPTGYRDIQPFQRGQGWHSNGKAATKRRHTREASERVVFPAIMSAQGVSAALSGPTLSSVDRINVAPQCDDTADVHEREEAAVSVLPLSPSSRPQRPSSGSRAESNQRAALGSFRTRAVAASVRGINSGLLSPMSKVSGRSEEEEEEANPPPDTETMEKLWLEYSERTRHPTKMVDRETYHRKVQLRYNEHKVLKEAISRLQMELEDAQRERDEAIQQAKQQTQWREADEWTHAGVDSSTESHSDDHVSHAALSTKTSHRHGVGSKYQYAPQVTSIEEISYRERCFKLERTMAATKEGVAQLHARLMAMHETDQDSIESLRAQLQLEQAVNKLLSVQLREANAAFRSTADELVTTQVALEKEQIEKHINVEQIHTEIGQPTSDQEEMLPSQEVKHDSLASEDGVVSGILQRATALYQGTRAVNGQCLMVHMLYEETCVMTNPTAIQDSTQDEPTSEPEVGCCIHILVCNTDTAQHDYIAYHLRDIRRLVPDADKYLAQFTDGKHERLLELAELLLEQSQIGYKNGHLIVTERPVSLLDAPKKERSEVVIYRGSRYLRSSCVNGQTQSTEALADLVVNEVYNPSTSQLWWVEVHATVVSHDNREEEFHLLINNQVLTSLVPPFASYRPSKSMQISDSGGEIDERDAFGIHEDLLDSLFAQMEIHQSTANGNDALSHLVLVDSDGLTLLCGGGKTPGVTNDGAAAETLDHDKDFVDGDCELTPPRQTTAVPLTLARMLDHRSIVCVDETFYCVRIQEVWDDELMLHVIMEEPDHALDRFEAVIQESEITRIAAFLHKIGVCEQNHAMSIKYGLPPTLHHSIAKLLKKHAKPHLKAPNGNPGAHQERVAVERISFESLHREIDLTASNSTSGGQVPRETMTLQQPDTLNRRSVEEVTVIGDDIDEFQVHQVLTWLREKSGHNASVTKKRIGCRLASAAVFATAMIYSELSSPFDDIAVIDISSVPRHTQPSPKTHISTGIVISRIPLGASLALLGFRGSTLD